MLLALRNMLLCLFIQFAHYACSVGSFLDGLSVDLCGRESVRETPKRSLKRTAPVAITL